MERNSNLGLKLTALALVAAGGMVRSRYETVPLRPQPTAVVRSVEPTVPELAAVQKEMHTESVQVLEAIDLQTLTDGKCHLKDPDIETTLLSLKAIDPKLLDSYIDAQLSVCVEK